MYQKDFIIFLIEQFARLVARIVAMITNREYDDAAFYIEQVYRQYLGVNSDLINAFSYRSLMSMMKIDPEAYGDKCIVLAELLRLEGRMFFEQGNMKEGFGRNLKSLNIFLTIFREDDGGHEEHHAKALEAAANLEEIAAKTDYEMPAETRAMLDRFLDSVNR